MPGSFFPWVDSLTELLYCELILLTARPGGRSSQSSRRLQSWSPQWSPASSLPLLLLRYPPVTTLYTTLLHVLQPTSLETMDHGGSFHRLGMLEWTNSPASLARWLIRHNPSGQAGVALRNRGRGQQDPRKAILLPYEPLTYCFPIPGSENIDILPAFLLEKSRFPAFRQYHSRASDVPW